LVTGTENGVCKSIETVIVILHYENDELTNKCIKSIYQNTKYNTYAVLVVDNYSPKPFQLKPNYVRSNTIVIRNNSRDSVSGMNAGYYHALYNINIKPKYVVNLDNDVTVLGNWLPPLIKEMEDNTNTGICGPRQWDEKQETYRCVGMDLMGVVRVNHPTERTNVVWMWGSAVMYRAEMMRMIGLHDTRYKVLCSDSDYCIHALDRGWRVVFVPESNVIHPGSSSYSDNYGDVSGEDRKQLVHKWYGMKFGNLMKSFPLDLQKKIVIESSFKEKPLKNMVFSKYEKSTCN